MTSDPFITQILQSTALRVHDAAACEARVFEMAPESPTIADEENVTPDERDAIRRYLHAYKAHCDQYDAAKADYDDALRAHAQAYRLATGRVICTDSAAVMQHLVNSRGAAQVCEAAAKNTPATPVNVSPPIARHARARGAGRPRAQAARSSAKSGDSGEDSDGPGEPEHGAEPVNR